MKKVLIIGAIFLLPFAAQADVAKGKELFTQKCATCHGPDGAGDGPAAAALPPEMKPRNLHTGPFKVAVDQAKLKDLIKQGGMPFGLSPLMAPQPMSDEELASVSDFVMSLRK